MAWGTKRTVFKMFWGTSTCKSHWIEDSLTDYRTCCALSRLGWTCLARNIALNTELYSIIKVSVLARTLFNITTTVHNRYSERWSICRTSIAICRQDSIAIQARIVTGLTNFTWLTVGNIYRFIVFWQAYTKLIHCVKCPKVNQCITTITLGWGCCCRTLLARILTI